MNETKPIPTSLKVVAALFILGGASSLIEVIVSLLYGHFSINFGVLGLFIGPGLLRLSAGWRTCALVFIWITLIGAPLVAVVFFALPGPIDFKLFGQKVGEAPRALGVAFAVVVFLIALWEYRVLTRPDVRELFRRPVA